MGIWGVPWCREILRWRKANSASSIPPAPPPPHKEHDRGRERWKWTRPHSALDDPLPAAWCLSAHYTRSDLEQPLRCFKLCRRMFWPIVCPKIRWLRNQKGGLELPSLLSQLCQEWAWHSWGFSPLNVVLDHIDILDHILICLIQHPIPGNI